MLEYVNLDQFLPLVLRDCPNVPRGVALYEIRQAAIQFCRQTRLWREDIVPFKTDPTVTITQYEFFTQAPQSRPIGVISLQADGRPLDPRTEDEMDRNEANWRTREGRPSGFISVSPSWVRPFPIPSTQPYTMTGKVAVAPAADGNYLLKDVFDDFAFAIAALAKGSLMRMPNKPWTNPDQSVLELNIGAAAVGTARSQASRNYSAAPRRRNRAYFQ